jgi:hypothetical protein
MVYMLIGILAFDVGFALGCAWHWLQTRDEFRPASAAHESTDEEALYVG